LGEAWIIKVAYASELRFGAFHVPAFEHFFGYLRSQGENVFGVFHVEVDGVVSLEGCRAGEHVAGFLRQRVNMPLKDFFKDFCDFLGWDSMVEADFEGVAVQADFFVVFVGEAGYVSVEDLEVADGNDVVSNGEDFGVVYGDFLHDAFYCAYAHVILNFEGSRREKVESRDEVA